MKKSYYVGTPNLPDKKKFTEMINKIWKAKNLPSPSGPVGHFSNPRTG